MFLIAASVAVGAAGPASAAGIQVASVEGPLAETDVNAAAWAGIPATEVEMSTAPSVHPAVVGEAKGVKLRVQAARTAKDILIRLQWNDGAVDKSRGPGRFPDGAAIQFPLDGSADTSVLMGGEGRLVNVWYWNASANKGENLVADGFGTLTPNAAAVVSASSAHAKGIWTVVFRRRLEGDGKAAVAFGKAAKGTTYPVAFAIWDGANRERDGFKAVTAEWQGLGF
jgi:DMSO reductase family type II enzyme heme b subunit